ncbi:uncharacterized protein LOC135926335 [Gordionus sp. m RMFG-2023]|uniref:uncharacterized protein LOC135926335 n=1 Tax=Gordionus sp. m RMFG-2023 TaxID=3053472 RepID=UPI0031FC48C3
MAILKRVYYESHDHVHVSYDHPTIDRDQGSQSDEINTCGKKASPNQIFSRHFFLTNMHNCKSDSTPTVFDECVAYHFPLMEITKDVNKVANAQKMLNILNSADNDIRNSLKDDELLWKEGSEWLEQTVQARLDHCVFRLILFAKTKIGGLNENGEIIVNLGQLLSKNFKYPLKLKWTSVASPQMRNDSIKQGTGKMDANVKDCKINMSSVFTPDQFNNPITLTKKLSSRTKPKGQILITLRYLPTSGRLQINFDKIRNIRFPFFAQNIQGLYIKVSLCLDRKLVNIKKTPTYHIIPQILMYQVVKDGSKEKVLNSANISNSPPSSISNRNKKNIFLKSGDKDKEKMQNSKEFGSEEIDDDNLVGILRTDTKSSLDCDDPENHEGSTVNTNKYFLMPNFQFREYSSSSDNEEGLGDQGYSNGPILKDFAYRSEIVESKDLTKKIKKKETINDGVPTPTMLFLLNPDEQRRATLFACLVALDPENKVQLFRKFTVGSVILGPKGNTTSREHWEEIIKKLRDPVSKWHDLI